MCEFTFNRNLRAALAAIGGAIGRVIAGSAVFGAALILGSKYAFAHPGHRVGETVLDEALHAWLGIHAPVVEPVFLLAVVIVVSRLAGWAIPRLTAGLGIQRNVWN